MPILLQRLSAPPEIRTQTETGLGRLPLPIALEEQMCGASSIPIPRALRTVKEGKLKIRRYRAYRTERFRRSVRASTPSTLAEPGRFERPLRFLADYSLAVSCFASQPRLQYRTGRTVKEVHSLVSRAVLSMTALPA